MKGRAGLYKNLSIWLTTHAILASLIVLVFSACPRVWVVWQADPTEVIKSIGDSTTYLVPATRLVEQGAFLNSRGTPEVARTPGYPAFLGSLMLMVAGNLHQTLILQAVVLSMIPLLLYLLARSILPPIMAFTGGLLACLSPWSILLAAYPLSDSTFLLFLCLIFFGMRLVEGVSHPVRLIFAGVSLGLLTGSAILVRPIWPLLILIAVGLIYNYGLEKKGVWLLLISFLIAASTPLALWKERNLREAGFESLSDVSGKTTWRYLASRVRSEVTGQDRFMLMREAMLEDRNWNMSIQEADDERWRRAMAVFNQHPVLTAYSFVRSAAEHAIHPSTNLLMPAKLNFSGDRQLFGTLWGGFLILSYIGWRCNDDLVWDDGRINRNWLSTILCIALLLTLSSGISFGAGARLRAPLELIVPLLSAVGLVRLFRAFRGLPIRSFEEPSIQTVNKEQPVLAVLIPVYNEVHTIEALIERVLASPVNMELKLFVVNDASHDGTGKVLDRLAAADTRITVFHHDVNRGKGMATRTAIQAAQGDFAIIQDADFEYNPNEYQRIVAPLLRGDAEAVFGSRYLDGHERRVLRYWHSKGNALLTTFFNIVHNMHLTDMETCYKAMPLRLLKNLRLTTDRFGIEPEIAARLVAVRARIIEVPISYNARSYQDGKKIEWRDAIDALCLTIKFKYFDRVPCIDAGTVRHLAMAEAPRYQHAIAHEIKPFLGPRVLEMGAGIGNLSKHLTDTNELFLSEPTTDYRRQLAASMEYRNNVTISEHDVFSADGLAWAKNIHPDTILYINELEQVPDDKPAIDCLAEAVKPGGRLIIIVSCHEFVYGSLDQALKRRRRYSANTITALLRGAGLQIEHQKWLGKLILVGWFIESKIWRRQYFAPKPFILVNIFSPIMRKLDNWLPWAGLSLLVIARKHD